MSIKIPASILLDILTAASDADTDVLPLFLLDLDDNLCKQLLSLLEVCGVDHDYRDWAIDELSQSLLI